MSMFGVEGTGPRFPSYLRTFLPTFLFVMVCGIVGPIFLLMYFVIDEPDTGWMLWSGLGITILDVVIAVVVSTAVSRSRVRATRLRATGVVAVAYIRSIEQTNVTVNDQPLMRLGLRVEGRGVVPFDKVITARVPMYRQPMLHARRLAVLVDPETQEIEVDWQGSALLAGTVPAVFSSSADGRTYDLTGNVEALTEIISILHRHGIRVQGSVDLRSDPVARREVMDVVMRSSGAVTPVGVAGPARSAVTPPLSAVTSAASARGPEQRLAELDDLRGRGVITEQEYAAARKRVIDAL